jgi:hypothetical protein
MPPPFDSAARLVYFANPKTARGLPPAPGLSKQIVLAVAFPFVTSTRGFVWLSVYTQEGA